MDGMLTSYISALSTAARQPRRVPLEVLVDDAELRITRRQGERRRCVVSFSGVGMQAAGLEEEVQKEEFGRSAGEVGEATLLFVIDKTRSWYNVVHGRVLDILRRELSGCEEVATLGNSMGGFAALRFAAELPGCRRAIAFSPQFSVHPAHVPRQERRWMQYRGAIGEHRFGQALEADTGTVDYWVFCGIEKLPDIAHFCAFRDLGRPNVHAVCLDRCGHDVAQMMQKAKVLGPVLEHLLPPGAGRRSGIDTLLFASGLSPMDDEAFRIRRAEQQQRRAQRLANPFPVPRRSGKRPMPNS